LPIVFAEYLPVVAQRAPLDTTCGKLAVACKGLWARMICLSGCGSDMVWYEYSIYKIWYRVEDHLAT
jgi:hypothetical protein